jgi:hypothetical protein
VVAFVRILMVLQLCHAHFSVPKHVYKMHAAVLLCCACLSSIACLGTLNMIRAQLDSNDMHAAVLLCCAARCRCLTFGRSRCPALRASGVQRTAS